MATIYDAIERRESYPAYGVATDYAAHRMRSKRTAFDLMGEANRAFQASFPAPAA